MHCDSGPSALQYRLFDHLIENIQRIGTLSVLHSSPYRKLIVRIKQEKYRASLRRQTRRMQTLALIERRYRRAMPYEKKEDDGSWGGVLRDLQ